MTNPLAADATLRIEEGNGMRDLLNMEGKTVLVTGGSRGIGEMIARGFVENGARVYISSRKADACATLAEELSASGECVALPADLSTSQGVDHLAAALAEREQKLDVLVNNAGASWGAPLDEFPEDGWDKTMNLNLKGVFFLTQRLLPLLRAAASPAQSARVINISSINGLRPPTIETYAYSASKAGLIMLTRHLAQRLIEENILVNAIAPGLFVTKMTTALVDHFLQETKMNRPGRPEEIAGVALFLASPAAGYTTGAVIPCDGGVAEF